MSRTLRTRMLLLVLAVVIPLTALAFYRAWDGRRVAVHRVEDRAAELAEQMAVSFEGRVGEAHTLVALLAALYDPRSSSAEVRAQLQSSFRTVSMRYANLWIADTLGNILGAVKDPTTGRDWAPIGDRAYFQESLRRRGFTVGAAVRSRISGNGSYLIPFSFPRIDSASGRVIAMAGASILVDSLELMRTARSLPPNSVITVLDSSGVVVLRSADMEGWLGRSFGNTDQFQQERSIKLGAASSRSADGTDRMVGFNTIPSTGWRVYVGLPFNATLDVERRRFLQEILLTVLISVSLLLYAQSQARRIASPIESLTRDALAIASGESTRRSSLQGTDEIGTLASAFNRMADDVSTRGEALAESAARYRLLFDANPTPVLAWDATTGAITVANDAAVRAFGGTREALVGRLMSDLIAPAQRGRFEEHVRFLPSGPRDDGTWSMIAIDGRALDVELHSARVERAEGTQVLQVALDVTARGEAERALRESQEQLRHAQRMDALGSFAAGIAHDFNNYLSSILGFTELARAEAQHDPQLQNDLDQVLAAGRRAADLTRRILVFSRKQPAEARVINVGAVVRSTVPMLERLMGEDVKVYVDVRDDDASVHLDPVNLEQVLVNLAANSRDAMRGGGSFLLSTRVVHVAPGAEPPHVALAPGSYVLLTSQDTGAGIPDDVRSRIFEPFFTTKSRGEGTGLGLSVVYGVMQQARGVVHVADAAAGGATFELYFPVTADATGAGVAADEKDPTGGTESILLVEDDPAVRRVTALMLRYAGYEVREASDFPSAIACFEHFSPPPDLLLTDIILPGPNGREIAEALLARRPELRVLVMSGYTDDEVLLRGIEVRGIAFLQKPAGRIALLRKVREVLDAAKTAVV